jgi:predicted nuclease of restriction endonuclease-like (RecB) superfamily
MSDLIQMDFNEVLLKIKQSKASALSEVNKVLIELYWSLGEYITQKSTKDNWGKSVVNELANFIQAHEPNIKGFTSRNLWRMKQFYETYHENLKLTPLVTQVTWSNHLLIMSVSKSNDEIEFYLKLCINERYSKRELERQIKSSVYERTLLVEKTFSNRVIPAISFSAHTWNNSIFV